MRHAVCNESASLQFLPLAHGNGCIRLLLLSSQFHDVSGGVRARGEEAYKWLPGIALSPCRVEVQRHCLRVALAQHPLHVILCRQYRSVLPKRPHQHQFMEACGLGVWERQRGGHRLGLVTVIPRLPRPFVLEDGIREVLKRLPPLQRHHIEPCLIRQPCVGLLANVLDVERCSALEKSIEVGVRDGVPLGQLDLEGKEQREQDPMLLKQAARNVCPSAVRQKVHNVADTPSQRCRFVG
mmetsp:Transcript_35581/g.57546  ORF Transcript_35581/g.57546 Transcript_35581/m.57546 type:complete len:239 (-) Transcript_35581:311-1027(-)